MITQQVDFRTASFVVIACIGIATAFGSCFGGQRLDAGTALHRLRQVRHAQEKYRDANEDGKYGTLRELGDAALIPADLVDGEDSGYRFDLDTSGSTYEISAEPIGIESGKALGNSFFMDETGVIRASNENFTKATNSSDPIKNQ